MKRINEIRFLSVIFLILLFLILTDTKAQSFNTNFYQYLSPVPGAKMVMPSSRILIRYGESFSPLTPQNSSDIIVTGEKSGYHKGKLILVENNELLSFIPSSPFEYGEKVTVELKNKFKLINDTYVPKLKYSFRITEKKIKDIINPLSFIRPGSGIEKINPEVQFKNQNINQDSLPTDFPDINVNNISNPTDGYIFFAPFIITTFSPTYLIITDNHGVPVFYRKTGNLNFDFKKQPNGYLSYYDLPSRCFYLMNNFYDIVDTLKMQNGYEADLHELRILDNGHSMMLGYDPEPVRMDTIVVGGNPNAVVTGLIIQELDENKNVVFQWRSWDHFQITDATYDISLTDSLIDYVHGNAIEIDYDGNILLSCRHMDEITKINRITGDIIWRWGGEYCKNNQFTFLNDPIGFSHQHHIRRLSNGNYTLFDNGNLHSPEFSRVAEYQMDEINKIVNLVWEYRNDPSTYSFAMGSAQRLPNHNTFIGWGATASSDIMEVGPDGANKLTISLPDTMYSYRAFKYDWDTDFFTSDKDTLQFGVVPVGDSAIISFVLTNNSDQSVEINSVYNRNSAFTLQQQLPIAILSHGNANLSAKFSPDTAGVYSDRLHLRWETEGQSIAKIIHLYGVTDSTYLSVNENELPDGFSLSQNYPNPFNPVSRIRYSLPHNSPVQLKVYDILGKEIKTIVNEEQDAGSYEVEFDGSKLSSGIYFYRINAGEYTSVKKMLLLK